MTPPVLGLIAAGVVLLTLLRLRAQRRSWAQQNVPKCSIAFDSAALVVTKLGSTSDGSVRLPWPEVTRVVAYKRDLFAYDCICLFVARADGTGIELNEEMLGWTDLCKTLPRLLIGCLAFEEWFVPVAFPAFAANPTELYARVAVHDPQ